MGVRITGIGIVSAIGLSVEENLLALKESRSGIAPAAFFKEASRQLLVGEVKVSDDDLKTQLGTGATNISRTSLLGLKAAREAWGSNVHTPALRTGNHFRHFGRWNGPERNFLQRLSGTK
jgi:3-oxoacyl-(acyl-carrier-protein) synthase